MSDQSHMHIQRTRFVAFVAALLMSAVGAAFAGVANEPLSVTRAVRPVVMLALSNDHQLYKKAYDDNTDIDNDGALETGYDNGYEYYGYFDPDTCYSYSSGDGLFTPSAAASSHQCSGAWSGNFLNWATMTRIDLLRRVLYGGHRVVDTATRTVLERALIPKDFHAFAKVFAPAGGAGDMALYTPYTLPAAITLCNVTDAVSGESQSLDTSANPPVIRVAAGAWKLWATGEASTIRIPCDWESDSSSQNIAPDANAALGVFNARVAACVSGHEGPLCKRYPDSTAEKPIGILQQYGDDRSLRFGLVTGSYTKNFSGGVLRRNSGFVADNEDALASDDEVDVDTGIFTGNGGIIATIESFRINKYDYGLNYYTDNCLSPGNSGSTDGQCTNWGNPIGEIVLETLRYLNGKAAATAAFDTDDTGVSSALGEVTWYDPMPASEWCADCSVLAITGGVNSFDRDQLASDIAGLSATVQTDLVGSAEGISGSYILGGNATENDGNCYGRHIGSLSEAVGVCPSGGKLEGGWLVAGLSYFAHVNDFRSDRRDTQNVVTRAIDMGDGMPHFQIRAHDPNFPQFSGFFTLTPACVTNNDTTADLPHARDLIEEIGFGAVVPADTGSGWRQCGLWEVLPMNLVRDAEGYIVGGDIYAFWEDTAYGNDSDLDAISRVHFCVGDALDGDGVGVCTDDPLDEGWGADKDPGAYTLPEVRKDYELRVTTSVVQAYTDKALSFGFVISGAHNPNQPNDFHCDNGYHGDGIYLEEVVHGVATDAGDSPSDKKEKKNKKDDDTGGDIGPFTVANADLSLSDDNPQRQPGACGRKFRAEEADPMLKPPLWYAAKYGGFNDLNDNDLPDLTDEWDTDHDGDPDGYYMLYQPQNVGQSFESIFSLISGISSSSSVVANSLVLQTGTYIYQGRFDSTDWSGDLIAFPVNMDGSLANPDWSAKQALETQLAQTGWDSSRVVLTSTGPSRQGAPFRWDDLTAAQQAALNANPVTGLADGLGSDRLDFIRGDRGNELQQGGGFRDRSWLLGDVVNSDPVFSGQPPFNYKDDLEPNASYNDFAATARDAILYVGGNDGMVHGFDTSDGSERLAYVPRALYRTLPMLSMLDYRDNHRYYVDGSLVLGDVVYSFDRVDGVNPWRTLLVGTLGAGGKGVFALDVTNPDDFSEATLDVAKLVRWDYTAADLGFAELGYTFSAPSLVKVPYWYAGGVYGSWMAVFGNGYESTSGTATLFAVGAGAGTRIAKVVAHAGPNNGLSSVASIDIDNDKQVDYIYAGDLLGNLWRFDAGAWGSWTVGLGGQPLFTATDRFGHPQPITVRPEVFRHELGGVVVVFGTGKYFETSDAAPDTSTVHSLYGVWDSLSGTRGNISRAHLLKQEFIAGGNSSGYDVRVSTDRDVTWHTGIGYPSGDPPTTHLGWYLDLMTPNPETGGATAEGEMLVAEIMSRGSRVIFTSMIPSEEPCEFGGEGWLIELSTLDGARPDAVLFDLNWDGVFSLEDVPTLSIDGADEQYPPNAKRSSIGIVQQPAIISAGTSEYKFSSGGMPASVEVTRENPGGATGGRQSWVELE